MKKSFAVLAAILALLALCPAQATESGGKTLLRFKWVKGRTYTYAIQFLAQFAGQRDPAAQTSAFTIQVLDAKGGTGTVKVKASGNMPLMDKPVTTTIDNRGRSSGLGMVQDELIQLPEKPVKVGQTWNYDQKTQTALGKAVASYTLTFKGLKTVDKVKVSVIGINLTLKGDNVSGSGKGELDLDAGDGLPVTMTQNLAIESKTTGSNGKTTSMSFPIKINLMRTGRSA